jgi:hypothetical protein
MGRISKSYENQKRGKFMKDEMEKEDLVFVKERIADFLGRVIWILVHILPALVAGRFFGIVVERVVFCLMLTVTCLKQIEALEMVKDLMDCIDDVIEEVKKKKGIKDDQTD